MYTETIDDLREDIYQLIRVAMTNPDGLEMFLWDNYAEYCLKFKGKEASIVASPNKIPSEVKSFLTNIGRPYIKTAFRGDGNPTDDDLAYEIGKSIIQMALGLAERISL